jgi:hypothetical protein
MPVRTRLIGAEVDAIGPVKLLKMPAANHLPLWQSATITYIAA